MTSEDRLREYVEKDEIYQKFITGILKANDMSDFDKFCVQHCLDIQEVLEENQELNKQLEGVREERDYLFNKLSVRNKYLAEENKVLDDKIRYYIDQKNEWVELLGKFKTQQKDFIMWLHSYIEKLTTTGCYNNDDDEILILKIVLKRYKEIVNGDDK